MKRRAEAAALLGSFVMLGVYFLFAWRRQPSMWVSFDIYEYFVPNMLHAARSLADGGRGLFWNPLLDCGQPFFAITSMGTLYPPNWLFFVLDTDLALRAVIVVNLAVAGAGAYLLGRALGLSKIAALCTAACFELGNATIDISTWTPHVMGAYVWLPAVMLCCERVLDRPTPARAVWLAASLTLALLPGAPQVVLFACQLIGLRLAWELLLRRAERPFAAILAVGCGLVLSLMLAAVQVLPGIEVARDSVRGAGLTEADILSSGAFRWEHFVSSLETRLAVGNPVIVVPAGVAAAGLIVSRAQGPALFYAAAGALYFVLAFGPATPLFTLYQQLPFGDLFRLPGRFLWVSSFCLAVVAGCGVETLTARAAGGGIRRVLAALVVAAFGLWTLAPSGLRLGEWLLLAAVAMAAAAAASSLQRRGAAVAVAAAVFGNLVSFPLWGSPERGAGSSALRRIPTRRLLADAGHLRQNEPTFAALRARMTAQDRVYLAHRHANYSFMPKTAALFGIPAVGDYEPQPSLRFARYLVMMRTGRPMAKLDDYYVRTGGELPPTLRRRLLDLAAARFLVVDGRLEGSLAALVPPPQLLEKGARLGIFENPLALPRARFVPRVEVVDDAEAILQRLAAGDDDLRQIAFIERPLAAGFTGEARGDSSGAVEFVRDDPERIVLRVRATGRGFLRLSDQWAPGWLATVNGAPATIARADYLFRLLEVPNGESVVELRYAPASVRLGAVISALTAAGLIAFRVRLPRHWRGAP